MVVDAAFVVVLEGVAFLVEEMFGKVRCRATGRQSLEMGQLRENTPGVTQHNALK